MINSEIEFPLNVTLTQQPLPTEGSIAWLAPAHPMSITLSGDNGVSDSVPLWWNDDSDFAKLSMAEKIIIPPTNTEIFISYATHPLTISLLLVLSLFGLLYLVRRDNKIDLDLYEDEAEEPETQPEDIKLEYIEEFDEIYEEYIEEGISTNKKGPPKKSTKSHPQILFSDVDDTVTSKKKRRRVSDEAARNSDGPIMKTKRRRLADDEPAAKPISVRRVVTGTPPSVGNAAPVIKKRRVKTFDEGKEIIPESKPKKSPPKKSKRRKPLRRKNKSSKKDKSIDEKLLQENLLDDFTSKKSEEE